MLAIQRQKSLESARLYKRLLDIKKRELDSLTAISKQLSVQYGLLDYDSQTREVLRAYYQMLSASKSGKPFEETSAQLKKHWRKKARSLKKNWTGILKIQ